MDGDTGLGRQILGQVFLPFDVEQSCILAGQLNFLDELDIIPAIPFGLLGDGEAAQRLVDDKAVGIGDRLAHEIGQALALDIEFQHLIALLIFEASVLVQYSPFDLLFNIIGALPQRLVGFLLAQCCRERLTGAALLSGSISISISQHVDVNSLVDLVSRVPCCVRSLPNRQDRKETEQESSTKFPPQKEIKKRQKKKKRHKQKRKSRERNQNKQNRRDKRAHHNKMEGAAVVARTLKALEVTDVVRTL